MDNNNRLLITSAAPHMVEPSNTARMMLDVVIAGIPALLWSCYIYGGRALYLTLVCMGSCVAFEWLTRKILGRTSTIKDWSAVVTGMVLAFVLPVTIPRWMAVIGCFTAIVVVKQLFGGLGGNFANPAVVGAITLLLSFPKQMTTWEINERMCPAIIASTPRGGATPLELFANAQPVPTNLQMFFGMISGPVGSLSALAVIAGGVYLIVRRVIDPVAPLCFVGSVMAVAVLSGQDPFFQVMAGGILFAAIFMASDPVTTPVTYAGKAVFGIGCGLLTMLMRSYATYPDSVLFAVLIMNILTPHIDRFTKTKPVKGGLPE